MAGDAACSREDAVLSDGVWEEKDEAKSPIEAKRSKASGQPHEDGGDGCEMTEKESRAEGDPEIQSALLHSSSVVGGKDVSPTAVRKAVPGEFDLLKVIGMGAFGKVLQVCLFDLYSTYSTAVPQQQQCPTAVQHVRAL